MLFKYSKPQPREQGIIFFGQLHHGLFVYHFMLYEKNYLFWSEPFACLYSQHDATPSANLPVTDLGHT